MYKENFTFESENGVYTWKNRNIKVEFSNPRIQPHHESFLKDADDILYYYYNMRVSRYAWINGEYEWKIVAEANAYDAPAVTYFCTLIEEELFEKYGEAILGRTAMCRDEHNLPILAERTEENYHANVYENIRRIIPMIKGMIKKN